MNRLTAIMVPVCAALSALWALAGTVARFMGHDEPAMYMFVLATFMAVLSVGFKLDSK